jgi:hypothetical protein
VTEILVLIISQTSPDRNRFLFADKPARTPLYHLFLVPPQWPIHSEPEASCRSKSCCWTHTDNCKVRVCEGLRARRGLVAECVDSNPHRWAGLPQVGVSFFFVSPIENRSAVRKQAGTWQLRGRLVSGEKSISFLSFPLSLAVFACVSPLQKSVLSGYCTANPIP